MEFADLPAKAAEQRPALRILDFALGAVDADAPAIAVVEGAALFIGGAGGGVERPAAPADQPSQLAAEAVVRETIVDRALDEDAAADPVLLGRADRDLVDHAAGGADALKRVGAVDQLDPVDEEGIDGVAVARAVADRGRLGNTVDGEQGRAAAQSLARARQLLPGRREGRRQRGDGIDGRAGNGDLLCQAFAVDDFDGQREGGGRKDGAGAGDDDVAGFEFLVRRGVPSNRDDSGCGCRFGRFLLLGEQRAWNQDKQRGRSRTKRQTHEILPR